MIKAYLAGSIFYEKDVMYNRHLCELIRRAVPGINLYSPVENTEINDKTKFADSKMIYYGDYKRLQETDILIAVIDGDVCPVGTAVEIGIFSELANQDKHKKIVALFTDSRDGYKTMIPEKVEIMKKEIAESQFSYTNLFLVGTIKTHGVLVNNTDDMCRWVKEYSKDIELWKD